MDVEALLAEYRRRADDTVETFHTSDEQAILMASEAEREAAMRSNLLFDVDTAGVAVYAVPADASLLQLSPLVYRIDAASYKPSSGGRARDLALKGIDWIRSRFDWQTRTCSYVEVLAHLERSQAWLFPKPRTTGTLSLHVYRLPLYDLTTLSDEPEIAVEHHDGLIDWMLYRTWSAKDSEQEDPARAARALADFTDRFGERPTADVMRRHREKRRVTTRYGG